MVVNANSDSFALRCVGHSDQKLYNELVLNVRHRGGNQWTVQRRYQDLLEMHERLCAVFGSGTLPAFPPKTPSLGAFFGQIVGCRPEILTQREWHFQNYFDVLCRNREVSNTACFQDVLGVEPPEPVAHLRVRGWVPALSDGVGATALLDIRAESAASDSRGVVESYQVASRVIFQDSCIDSEEVKCLISEFLIPSDDGGATVAQVPDLKAGAQVELEVSAKNSVGMSGSVAIRFLVPQACASRTFSAPGYGTHPSSLDCDSIGTVTAALSASTLYAREKIASGEGNGIGSYSLARFCPSPPESPRHRERDRLEMEEHLAELTCQQEVLTFHWEQRNWEQRNAEAERAIEEHSRMAAALAAQEAEVERRVLQLRTLEQRHEVAMEKSEERQRHEQAELQRAQEDLQRQQWEQRKAHEVAQARASASAKALAEQQEKLELERIEVESSRLAGEAERQSRLETLAYERVELERRQLELSEAQEEQERNQQLQADDLERAESETLERLQRLREKEDQLRMEQDSLHRSRRCLAVVQAHVLNMIDGNRPGEVSLHHMDQGASSADLLAANAISEDHDDDKPDKLWSMDWTAPIFPSNPSKCSSFGDEPTPKHVEEASP